VKEEDVKIKLMLFEINEAFNHTNEICYNEKTINKVRVLLRPQFLLEKVRPPKKLDPLRTPLTKRIVT